jgi:hypothetical protein
MQGTNLLCTFSVPAPVGSDSFSLTLTDGANTPLSRNVVTATIASGISTPINVTLAAIPASVAIVPGSGAVIDGSAPNYHFPGLYPQPVEVRPLDADGNVIIGPGAPSISSVSVTSGSAYAGVKPSGGTDPNAYILAPVDGTAGGQTITVSATVQGMPLSDGTTSQPVTGSTAYTFTPAIAIGSGLFVSVYSVESGREVALFRECGAFCQAIAIATAVDAKGNVYAGYNIIGGLGTTSYIAVFAPGSLVPKYTLGPSQVHRVSGIAVDQSGNLYVANGLLPGFPPHPASVMEFSPGAKTASYTISGISSPGGVAVDQSGDVYVVNGGTDTVTVYKPHTATPYETLTLPTGASPVWIAVDKSGGVYVSDLKNEDIDYFAPGTTVSSTLSDSSFFGATTNNLPLLVDPNGDLWVSIASAAMVERFDAAALPKTLTLDQQITGTAGTMAWIP